VSAGAGGAGAHAVVAGVGGALAPRVVDNEHLASFLDTSDEWISSRTGIRSRRWVSPGMSTADLAAHAGARALESAGGAPPDAVVLATATPDRPVPGTAPEVASRLGLAGAAAYDVAAVCTGFVYGLATAAGLIAAGTARRVLLIGAEAYSTIVDPTDRGTAIIFGDGAGAVLLRAGAADEPGAVGPCDLGSDGGLSHLAMIPAGGSRQRSAGGSARPEDHFFRMHGRELYRHAVERMAQSGRRALDRAGWRVTDVDRLVPHQANAKIAAGVAQRLGVPADRHLSNIAHVGNTAAASIPLLLTEAAADGRLRPGHRVLIVAFGSGLTWGAATLVWPEVAALAPEAVPEPPLADVTAPLSPAGPVTAASLLPAVAGPVTAASMLPGVAAPVTAASRLPAAPAPPPLAAAP